MVGTYVTCVVHRFDVGKNLSERGRILRLLWKMGLREYRTK